MPAGPNGEKRPGDVIGNAVKVMRIATGEEEDTEPTLEGTSSQGRSERREGLGLRLCLPRIRHAIA
jgi:hypothetical protein